MLKRSPQRGSSYLLAGIIVVAISGGALLIRAQEKALAQEAAKDALFKATFDFKGLLLRSGAPDWDSKQRLQARLDARANAAYTESNSSPLIIMTMDNLENPKLAPNSIVAEVERGAISQGLSSFSPGNSGEGCLDFFSPPAVPEYRFWIVAFQPYGPCVVQSVGVADGTADVAYSLPAPPLPTSTPPPAPTAPPLPTATPVNTPTGSTNPTPVPTVPGGGGGVGDGGGDPCGSGSFKDPGRLDLPLQPCSI